MQNQGKFAFKRLSQADNTGAALKTLEHHTKAVMRVEWCPAKRGVVASGSEDRFICIWDVSHQLQETIQYAGQLCLATFLHVTLKALCSSTGLNPKLEHPSHVNCCSSMLVSPRGHHDMIDQTGLVCIPNRNECCLLCDLRTCLRSSRSCSRFPVESS